MNDLNKEKTIEFYWLNRLSGDLPKITLPTVPAADEDEEKAKGLLRLPIPGTAAEGLATVSKGSAKGLFVLFFSGLNLLLHKYTGLEDLVVGTVSPRKEGVKKDTLILCRNRVNGDAALKEIIQQVNKNVTADFNHRDYSFGLLFQKLASQKGGVPEPGQMLGGLPIFNIAFIYGELQNRSKLLNQFDVVLQLRQEEEQLVLEIENRSKDYARETLLRLGRNLCHVMEHLEENLDNTVSVVDILSPQEQEELAAFNRTQSPYPKEKTIHQLFEEQVRRTPECIAVTSQFPGDMTYTQLNEKANRLAHLLRQKGVRPGTVVGLLKERSPEMVADMLAIMKAGAAYLPLDGQAPTRRIASMLNDCAAQVLLTDSAAAADHAFTALQGLDRGQIEPPHLHLTGPCERIGDFDALPFPDRSLVDYEKYNRLLGQSLVKNRIVIQASRGCPHKCSYCYRIWPRKQAARSGENLFEEVKLYYDMGIRKFDIFMLNIKQGRRLFELITENGITDVQLFFPNGFRGDLLTRDYIDLMVRAGTVNFALALETASPRLQKLIDKHLDLDKFRQTVEYVCETYPHVILELFTMHGIPSETEEEAMLTLDFIKSLKWVHFPYVNVLKIYRNTGMEQLALDNDISREAILRSENMAWHEWSETLPFDRSFTARYQSDFLDRYVLSRERLLEVLPHQMKILGETELVEKYDSYLPGDIKSFDDLLRFAGLDNEPQLKTYKFRDETEDIEALTGFNEKLTGYFRVNKPGDGALRVLLLDLSQFFSHDGEMLYDVVDPPLGLIYLLTYLNEQLGAKINGKIKKSRLDFDSLDALKTELEAFQPQVIGIRTLSYYRDFFHRTVSAIRQWGFDAPIITGGPYATVDYDTLLKDGNIDLAVLGEGEKTFCRLIEAVLANDGQLPGSEVLETIPGVAFVRRDTGFREFGREVLMAEDLPGVLSKQPAADPEQINQPGDPAYVIFTSGSTGKPKGVLVEHGNVVNVLSWFGRTYGLKEGTAVIQLTSHTFDPSVEQIFGTLLHGGTVYIASKELLTDKVLFRGYVERNGIEVINTVPGVLRELLADETKLESLRAVISGAERLDENLKMRLLEKGYRVYNHYGPTETTIEALAGECLRKPVTLGGPIANVSVHILGKDGYDVPIGVQGELCISGAGVARGYLNNPDLTAEKFLTNIYRTGDRARWLPDGTVEFFGRRDHQIKIRGFRVELGEIENQLLKNKEIKAAVVTPRDTGDLCAYVVPEQQGAVQDFDPSALKEFLSLELPPYMIPTHIVTMEQFPVTPGGKIDRQALPSPEVSAAEQYTAPEDDHQTLLADIWSGVLGVEKERIGIDTNFFETGGDSIKVIQISARLRKHGLKLENGDVFQYPTIRQLSGFITPLDHAASQETVKGDVPLTPIQHWFFDENTVEPNHFNQAVMLFSPDRFDPETVKAVFQKIQHHHDALRMTFKREGDKITQFNGENMPLSLDIHDLRHMDGEEARGMLHEAANRIQAGINLETGPPLKLGLFQLSDGDRLLVVVHHLVMDGISWRILFEDIDRLYRDYRDGKQPELPPKSDSFKQWAEELVKYAQTPAFLKEKVYWKPMESVTTDRVVPIEAGTAAAGMKDVENLAVTLEPGQTQLLLSGVNHAFGTDINDILLTGLGLALHSLYGVRQFPVVMEGHGREDILKGVDITRTVGWFTSQYPVLLDFSHARDRGRQVKEVKETLRRVPHKGIGYGILKYLTGEEHKEGVGFSLKPQVAFNYLGQFDADLETTGFGMAAEPVGLTRSEKGTQEHELEVVVMITGGRLVLSVSFGKNRFKPSAIEELLEAYKNELGGLIDFCTAREERERTPSDFTSKGLTVTDLEIIQKAVTGPVEDIYRLTPMQEGMLFHTVYDEDGEGGTSAYFEQISYHLHGELDAGAVEKSLNELLKRHDILRTAFVHRGLDRPVQVVSAEREADFYWKDIHENIPPEGTEVFIEKFKAEDRRRSFDLVKDVLMRVSVFRTGKEDYEFTWSHHHILMDGWCNGILIGEFFHIYNSILGGSEYRLPEGTAYRTYIRWLEAQDPDVSKRYWADYLSGYETAAEVPRLKEPPTARADYKNEKVTVSLDTDETGRLVRLTAALRVTVNTLVQALWGVVFGRYNGCRDVVFGAVVSGRPAHIEDVERMVGLFINTVPVRIRYGEDTDFASLVKEIQQVAVESETHHYYPLAEIQSHSVLKQRLMDHIMVFENFPVAQQIEEKAREMESEAGGKPVLRVSRIEAFEQTNYDFNLIVLPGPRLSMRFEFNGHMFDGSMVAGMGAHLVTALRSILDSEDLNRLRTVDISILAEEEKKRLLEDFNRTETPYPEDKTVHGLFEEQVERTPGDIAVIGGEGRFTFGELNERANVLALRLREQGVQRNTIVAVKTDRSVETTAVILGILKAGGAYLPLDEQLPQGRIDYMLADSGTKIVLNSSDAASAGASGASGAGNPGAGVQPGDMVQVLYTSGSTGRPKGVVLTHGNVVNFIHDLHERFYKKYRTGVRLKLAVIAPYVFAGSVKQVFTSLVFGHTLHIIPEECRFDGELLAQFFDDSGIHITDAVPAHIKLLTEAFRRREKKFCGVRHFNISADVLSKELVAEFLGILEEPKPDLANLYGPTECCVDAVGYDINALEVEGLRTVPIGVPLGNTSVYVLDGDMRLVPVGVTGEIYISGHGVARGYLNNPNLTAESFLIKSFCPAFLKKRAAGGINIYKTGDLGRWLADGKLEFLGRRDRQVKIRGYRIETGEIEVVMQKHESVEKVVIRPLEMVGGETVLCAYFVPVGSIDLTPSLWREYLGKQLPSYMIPSHFMAVETIPLTASGKPDIKALPRPEAVPGGAGAYLAPSNESEEKIVQTWAEVLGMDAGTIGVEDDFFALGGNSINVFKVVNRLNRDFGVELPLSSLFLYPTVRQLAENVMEESLLGKLECVVRLNRSTAGKNIFILHPMHGMAYLYRGLAEALEGSFNVYGIQGRGLAKPGPLPETMADMVSDYIEQIRAVQPEGPYIIGGHCFGDIAAYNLVKQLENMGQVVERQVMFDEPSFIPAFVERHHKRRERLGAVSGPLKKVARRLTGKNEQEEQLTPFQQARQAFENKGDAGVTGPLVPASLENDPEQRKARVHIHIKRLDEGYWKIDPFQRQLGIIRAPLLILKAAKRNHRNFAMKELKRMTYGEVTLRETPGTHDTLFLPEHIPTLAGILKELL